MSTAKVNAPIVDDGKAVAMVYVRQLPAGAVLSIGIGRNPVIPNVVEREGWEACPPDSGGVYVTAPAQPGVIAKVLVSYAP